MARMENGGIELKGEAGRSNSYGHGAFFVFHLHRGLGRFFSFLFPYLGDLYILLQGFITLFSFVIFQE